MSTGTGEGVPEAIPELVREFIPESMPEFIPFPIDSPFVDTLGLKLRRSAPGECEILLPMQPHLLNTWAVTHGGVTMSLLDAALGVAARSRATGEAGVVTLEMKVSFMQPGRGDLTAFARVLHRSSTIAFCEGEVRDAQGNFVAKALGSFKYVKRLAVGRDIAVQRRAASHPSGD